MNEHWEVSTIIFLILLMKPHHYGKAKIQTQMENSGLHVLNYYVILPLLAIKDLKKFHLELGSVKYM